MIAWSLRRASWILAALSLSAFAGFGRAQSVSDRRSDYLDQARSVNDIAAQKIEADVRATLRATQRMMFSEPAKAIERLKQTLAMLTDDTVLSESRRATLIRVVKDRIRVAQGVPSQDNTADVRRAEVAGRQAGQDQQNAADRDVQNTLRTIRQLQQDGRTAEARQLAADLAHRYPDNAAAQAASRAAAAADRVAGNQGVRRQAQERVASALTDVDRSNMPPSGDVEFPKDWKEKTARRKKYAGVQLSPKEKAILQALAAPVSVNFSNSTFETAIDYLSTLSNQPIIVDKGALKDADISYDAPVNFKLKNVSLRTVLRKMLSDYGLAYVIKDQTIFVTTAAKAKEMMVVRSYPIGDLITANGGQGLNPLAWGLAPGLTQAQMQQNVNGIIEMIQSTIEPDSWKANGGAGSIAFYAPTMSLVVRQSAEVHAMMGGGFSH